MWLSRIQDLGWHHCFDSVLKAALMWCWFACAHGLAAAFLDFSCQVSMDAMESRSTVIRALNLEPPKLKKIAQKNSISGPGLTGRPLGASEVANPESLTPQLFVCLSFFMHFKVGRHREVTLFSLNSDLTFGLKDPKWIVGVKCCKRSVFLVFFFSAMASVQREGNHRSRGSCQGPRAIGALLEAFATIRTWPTT